MLAAVALFPVVVLTEWGDSFVISPRWTWSEFRIAGWLVLTSAGLLGWAWLWSRNEPSNAGDGTTPRQTNRRRIGFGVTAMLATAPSLIWMTPASWFAGLAPTTALLWVVEGHTFSEESFRYPPWYAASVAELFEDRLSLDEKQQLLLTLMEQDPKAFEPYGSYPLLYLPASDTIERALTDGSLDPKLRDLLLPRVDRFSLQIEPTSGASPAHDIYATFSYDAPARSLPGTDLFVVPIEVLIDGRTVADAWFPGALPRRSERRMMPIATTLGAGSEFAFSMSSDALQTDREHEITLRFAWILYRYPQQSDYNLMVTLTADYGSGSTITPTSNVIVVDTAEVSATVAAD